MRPHTAPLVFLSYATVILCLACAAYGSSIGSAPEAEQPLYSGSNSDAEERGQREISPATFQHMLAVRSPKYNFGLGKRKYVIQDVPGAKRLPQYNFGLGKRAIMDMYDYEENSMPSWSGDYSSLIPRAVPDYDADKEKAAEKRAPDSRRYAFGLGKRRSYDFGLGKRSYPSGEDKRLPNRYNFGLGRR